MSEWKSLKGIVSHLQFSKNKRQVNEKSLACLLICILLSNIRGIYKIRIFAISSIKAEILCFRYSFHTLSILPFPAITLPVCFTIRFNMECWLKNLRKFCFALYLWFYKNTIACFRPAKRNKIFCFIFKTLTF